VALPQFGLLDHSPQVLPLQLEVLLAAALAVEFGREHPARLAQRACALLPHPRPDAVRMETVSALRPETHFAVQANSARLLSVQLLRTFHPGNLGRLGGVPGKVGCREVVVAGVLGSWLSWGVVSAELEAAGEDEDGGHPNH